MKRGTAKAMVRSKLFMGVAVILLSMSVVSSAATRTTTIYVTRRLRHLD